MPDQGAYLLYLDESGVEQIGQGTDHFVLLGLAVRLDHWKALDLSVEKIKKKYGLGSAEIHTAWMNRRYSEQEAINGFSKLTPQKRRDSFAKKVKERAGLLGVEGSTKKIKSYRREIKIITPYAHLTREERIDCLKNLATVLGRDGDVRILAEAISKPDFHHKELSPYEMAFEQVLTRYDTMLSNFRMKGIVIADNNATAAPRLTKLCRQFHQQGTFYRRITNVIETPFFVDSSLTTMVQMADLCVYSLRRYIENGESELWDLVKSRVDLLRDGKAVGLRHYTGQRKCNCQLCKAHGR